MTQPHDQTSPLMNVPEDEFEDEINLLDLLQVILKQKKMIAQIVVAAVVLSVIVSLLLPKMYAATARVLPPSESSSSLSSLLSQTGGAFAGLAGGLIGGKTTAELYRGILGDIEAHGYQVFARRAYLTRWGKLRRLPGIWWRARRGYGEGKR